LDASLPPFIPCRIFRSAAGYSSCKEVTESLGSRYATLGAVVEGSIANLLTADDATASTWFAFLSRPYPTGNGIESVALNLSRTLLQLHRSGAAVDQLVEVLAGGSRGLELIRHDPSIGYYLVMHAKEVSPAWWESMKPRLATLPSELWVAGEHDLLLGFTSGSEFARLVDMAPPCDACPRTLHLREKTATTDDMRPSGHTIAQRLTTFRADGFNTVRRLLRFALVHRQSRHDEETGAAYEPRGDVRESEVAGGELATRAECGEHGIVAGAHNSSDGRHGEELVVPEPTGALNIPSGRPHGDAGRMVAIGRSNSGESIVQ
jgi:hypothetical protein